jgi:hypothetical protein
MQEILDTPEPAGMGTDTLDQASGAGIDPRLGFGRARNRSEQPGRNLFVRRRIGCDKSA